MLDMFIKMVLEGPWTRMNGSLFLSCDLSSVEFVVHVAFSPPYHALPRRTWYSESTFQRTNVRQQRSWAFKVSNHIFVVASRDHMMCPGIGFCSCVHWSRRRAAVVTAPSHRLLMIQMIVYKCIMCTQYCSISVGNQSMGACSEYPTDLPFLLPIANLTSHTAAS